MPAPGLAKSKNDDGPSCRAMWHIVPSSRLQLCGTRPCLSGRSSISSVRRSRPDMEYAPVTCQDVSW